MKNTTEGLEKMLEKFCTDQEDLIEEMESYSSDVAAFLADNCFDDTISTLDNIINNASIVIKKIEKFQEKYDDYEEAIED